MKKFGTLKSTTGILFGTVGATVEDDSISMDYIQKILYRGKKVYDVKIAVDNSIMNGIVGNEYKHIEFKTDGIDKVLISHYYWFIFSDTDQNQKRLNEIEEIELKMKELQNKKSQLINEALMETYK